MILLKLKDIKKKKNFSYILKLKIETKLIVTKFNQKNKILNMLAIQFK